LTQFVLATLVMLLPVGLLRRRPLPALVLMLVGLVAVAMFRSPWDAWGSGDIWILQLVAVDLAVGFIAAAWPAGPRSSPPRWPPCPNLNRRG
jgi:hypothetical protein